jgi:hypothetical protein
MPYKRKVEGPLFLKTEKVGAGVSLIVGIVLSIGLAYSHFNLYKTKPIQKIIAPDSVDLTVTMGKHVIKVSIYMTLGDEGSRRNIINPTSGCPDMMVVDLKERDSFRWAEEPLRALSAVERFEVFSPYRIIIHRPCTVRGSSLWSWKEVWAAVEPILKKHYEEEGK